MSTLLRIGLGILVLGHGVAHGVASPVSLGYAQGTFAKPTWMPVWLRSVSFVLWLGAAALLMVAAVAIFRNTDWISHVVVPAAAVSLAVLTLWWGPLPVGGKLGVVFDVGSIVWGSVWA